MGLLKTIHIKVKELSFKYKVYVDRHGEFRTTLPSEVATMLDKCGIALGRNRLKKEGYIHRTTLVELESEVKRLIDEYYSEELIS